MNSTMHYQTYGTGKPIMLIHGWTMDSRVWSFFIEEFSPDHTIISVDLRGHGQSGAMPGPYNLKTFAMDLRDLMEDLALRDATLIGWSMGVSVALKLFEYAAPAFDSLVFISGTPSLVARTDYPHGLPRAEVSSLLRSIKKEYVPGMAGFYKLMFQGEDAHHPRRQEIQALAADTSRAPRQEVACEALQSLQQEDLRPCLEKIRVPVLLVHGGLDRICLPAAARYMAEQVTNSSLCILDAVGHVPFLTAAEQVHRKVKNFIRLHQ
jgi:pimeloyl-[acyl-carrier protein] methyl ester esterase